MTDSTSATLLERVRDARDAGAWQEFFRLYYPLVTKYARIRGLRAADAEEVAQECMKSLARHMRRFHYSRGRGRFRGFLRKTVNNQIISLHRRKRLPQTGGGHLENLASSGPLGSGTQMVEPRRE